MVKNEMQKTEKMDKEDPKNEEVTHDCNLHILISYLKFCSFAYSRLIYRGSFIRSILFG